MYKQEVVDLIRNNVEDINNKYEVTLHPISIHYNIIRPTLIPVFVLQDPTEVVCGATRVSYLLHELNGLTIAVLNIMTLVGVHGVNWQHLIPLSVLAMPLVDEPDEIYYEIRDVIKNYADYLSILFTYTLEASKVSTRIDVWSMGMMGLLLNSLRSSTTKFNTARDLLEINNIETPLVLTTEDSHDTFLHKVIKTFPSDVPRGDHKHLLDYFKRLMRVFLG